MNRLAVQISREEADRFFELVEDQDLEVAKYTNVENIKRRVESFNKGHKLKKKHLTAEISPMELAIALENKWIEQEAVKEEAAKSYKTIEDALEAK